MSYTFAITKAALPADFKAAMREFEHLVEQPEPDRAAFDALVD